MNDDRTTPPGDNDELADFQSEEPVELTHIVCAICKQDTPARYMATCQWPFPEMCWSCASQNPRTHGLDTCRFCEERHCLECTRYRPKELPVAYCSIRCREAWQVRNALELATVPIDPVYLPRYVYDE